MLNAPSTKTGAGEKNVFSMQKSIFYNQAKNDMVHSKISPINYSLQLSFSIFTDADAKI
jgi:hypothetical protein